MPNTISVNTDILSSKFLEKYKNKKIPWGFGNLGYIVYKRCVDIDTPVLCDDLTWKKAGELKVEDGIIGFDETPVSKIKNKTRYIRFGKVTHNSIENAKCLGIELEDGTVIYSTPDHSWLVKFDGDSVIHWRETKDLQSTKYNNPVYLLRVFGKPWEINKTYESGYLAGVFDGEGCLDATFGITFTQVNNCVLTKTEEIINLLNFKFKKQIKSLKTSYKYKNNRQVCYDLRMYGIKNIIRFLGQIRPQRLLDKFINGCKNHTNKRFGKQMCCNEEDYVKVIRVFDAGIRQIAVLSTNIKTHFTGGFASHNTYARIKNDGTTEEWWETVTRCVNGAQRIGAQYTQEEAERLFDYVFNLKGCFSGRGLWQLGTKLVDDLKLGDSLLNCWGSKTSEVKDFSFIVMESFFGGGVGCNVAREYTQELPRVKRGVRCRLKNTNDADFITPDSKEGWVVLWYKILESYLITGKSFTYSTVCIRPAGQELKTFGGISPGPQILIDGVFSICNVMEKREGKKLRTEDVADIITIGGEMVKSGGVRRTAILLGGDVDDIAYLRLKRWDLEDTIIPNHRSNSNNSLICPKYSHLQESFWQGYQGNGESYGLINLPLMRKFGRLGETEFDGFNLNNSDIIICNPCAEANLEDKEPCNLAELNFNNIETKEEALDIAKLLYKTQKAICSMNYYHEESNEVVHRNFKLGLSITGICQKLDKIDEWCDYIYVKLRSFDKEWSKKRNWPQSIRLTVIQPSGTKSLLLGATPGAHPGYAQYFTRNIRFDSKDPLIPLLKEHGYKIEPEKRFDGSSNHGLLIVSFPCKFENNVLLAKDTTAISQLELSKKLQKVWADQSISMTVYYKKDELSQIKEWLKNNYNDNIKSVSFLLHTDHNFKQAPYIPISEEEYKNELNKIKLIEHANISNHDSLDTLECSGGVCPIK